MEKYVKGKCIEEPLDRANIPIPNLSNDFLWMQVKGGSKMQRLTDHALGVLNNDEARSCVWTGSGEAVIRTIACAEAVKRRSKAPLHQITKIGYRRVQESWEPKCPADGLDPLLVARDVPIVHVLLSLDPLDSSEPGYQTKWRGDFEGESASVGRARVTAEEISAMGLQSNGRGNRNNYNGDVKNKAKRKC